MVAACDVLAIGAHPDDVELGCAGTVARLTAAGRRVAILDLTAGELGTRGDAALRAAEARAAAAALGAVWRECLALPDGGLRGDDDAALAAVVAALRTAAPRVVFLPERHDPHPDHAAAAALVARGSFLAGVGKFHPECGAPSRPRLLLAYPGPRQVLAPALVIDVTAGYAAKARALAAHASQFDPAAGAATHLASGHFLAAIEGRDRACGNLASVEVGEGFVAVGALPADELVWLFGGRGSSPEPRTPDPGRGGRDR